MGDRQWKIAGINFDHMHMGDNLRMAHEHPQVEIVGICDEDPSRMQDAVRNFDIPDDRVFTDYIECIEKAGPDVVLLCPATARHGEWTKKIAPLGVHVIMEKPFAASLEEADKQAREIVDPWGNPLVYFHNRDYKKPKSYMCTYKLLGRKNASGFKPGKSKKTATYHSWSSYQIWSVGPNGENENGEGDDIGSWGGK